MSSQNSSSFCIFCYKTIHQLSHSLSNVESVKKFIQILSRLVDGSKYDILLKVGTYEKQPEILLNCCLKCKEIVNQFCEFYHQLKILELKLDWKLHELTETLEFANKVPTRWIHVNKVLEETFPNDLIKRKENLNGIRAFRQCVVNAAQISRHDQPRVLVEKIISTSSAVYPTNHNQRNEDDLSFKDITTHFKKRQFVSLCDHDINNDISAKSSECDNESIGWVPEQIKVEIPEKLEEKRKVGLPKKYWEARITSQIRKVGRSKSPQKIRNRTKRLYMKRTTTKSSLETDRKFSFCRNCKNSFPTLKILKAHMSSGLCAVKKSEGSDKLMTCGECRQGFNLDRDLWLHQKEVHGERVCLDCGKAFSKTYNLKVHLEYHKDPIEWKFTCEICGQKCPFSGKLRDHMATHSRKNKNTNNLDKVLIEREQKPVATHYKKFNRQINKCTICGKEFKQNHYFHVHLEYHKDPSEWRFECGICGKKCAAKNKLKEHVARHVKNKRNGKVLKTKQRVEKIRLGDSAKNDIKRENEIVGDGINDGEEKVGNIDVVKETGNDESIDEIEEREVQVKNLNAVGCQRNVLAWKGDSFGDGTLHNFDDLD